MSDIPARTRQELAERSEHQCELWSLSGGRCSEWGTDAHHVKLRSHGGGHEITNLIRLCRRHHQAAHREIRPSLNGPFQDDHGRYYTQDVGPPDEVEIVKWHVWPDIAEEMQAREEHIHTYMQRAAATANASRIAIATLCAEIHAMGLYSLRGYDSAIDYVIGEIGESESGARNCLRVGEFFRVNPHLQQKAIEESLGWSLVRSVIAPLKKLPGERVEPVFDEMIEAQRNAVPAEAIVESVREAAGVSRRSLETMTCSVSLSERAVTLIVTGQTPEARLASFRKQLGKSDEFLNALRIET